MFFDGVTQFSIKMNEEYLSTEFVFEAIDEKWLVCDCNNSYQHRSQELSSISMKDLAIFSSNITPGFGGYEHF